MADVNRELLRGLPGYGAVGAVGFIVDGGLLAALYHGWAVGPTAARCLSFPLALTVTWLLNRRWVFGPARLLSSFREYLAYAAIQTIGALLNLGLFAWLVHRVIWMAAFPLLPFALASLAVLTFNFILLSRFVYR